MSKHAMHSRGGSGGAASPPRTSERKEPAGQGEVDPGEVDVYTSKDVRAAIRLATECIEAEIHRLSFDANLAERMGADYPCALRSVKRRAALQKAKKTIRYFSDRWEI